MHYCKVVSFAVGAATIAAICLAATQDPKSTTPQAPVAAMFTPADMKWVDAPPGLPPGGKVAVLAGDPSKAGLFTMRGKFPAGYKIPPHFHPGTEDVTVISGTLNVAVGDTFDAAKAKALPLGSFASLPAKSHHFAFSSEETVIQVSGMGPFEITYVNPADDPRKADASKKDEGKKK